MNNDIDSRPSPAEEDPQLHSLLAALPHYAPSDGFADRVLAEVWRPAPVWVRQVRRAAGALFDRKRVWVVAGGLAASSTVTAVFVAAVLVANWVQVQSAWAVFTGGVLLELWRVALRAATQTVVWLNAATAPFSANTALLMATVAGGAFTMAVSAWGLRRTIRQYNTRRVTVHAGH